MKRITPEEAAAKREEGYLYLDGRSVPEFEAGHPKGREAGWRSADLLQATTAEPGRACADLKG